MAKAKTELKPLGSAEFGKLLKDGDVKIRGGKATITHTRKTRGAPIVNTYHINLPPILAELEVPEEATLKRKPGRKAKTEKTAEPKKRGRKPGRKPKAKTEGEDPKRRGRKPGRKPKTAAPETDVATETGAPAPEKPKRKVRTKAGRKPRTKKAAPAESAEKPPTAPAKPKAATGVPWSDDDDDYDI